MEPITYQRPTALGDALAMLAGPGSRPLAGGTDLVPQLREGRRKYGTIVDLKHIPELGAIAQTADGGWRIGAAVSVLALGRHARLAADHPGLLAAARLIGSLQIQARATLGGNVANAAPSADAAPLLVSLGAQAEIAGPSGRRHVPLDSVFVGPGKSILAQGEVLASIVLPPRPARYGAAYLRFTPRREMDIAIAGSGAALSLDASGTITSARVTLASVAPVPLRAMDAEAHLAGKRPTPDVLAEAARLAAEAARPIGDTRASADYRRHLAGVLTRRALEACLAEASTNGGRT